MNRRKEKEPKIFKFNERKKNDKLVKENDKLVNELKKDGTDDDTSSDDTKGNVA